MRSREVIAKQAVAHRIFRQEIKSGRLVRPKTCEKCGNDPGQAKDGRSLIQGHHHRGYDYPRDVEWLCVKCHSIETPRLTGDEHPMRAQPDKCARGTANGFAKLTAKQALAVFRAAGSLKAVAERFGVSQYAIWAIRKGLTWGHVTGARLTTPKSLTAMEKG